MSCGVCTVLDRLIWSRCWRKPNSTSALTSLLSRQKSAKVKWIRRRPPMPPALLLIAHGSRHAEANADLLHVADQLRQRGHAVVVPAFLELAEPDIDRGAELCLEAGATSIVLVPYFLSTGVHVARDLSAARDRLAARHPAVE